MPASQEQEPAAQERIAPLLVFDAPPLLGRWMGEWAGAYAEQLRADAAWHAGDAVASAASGALAQLLSEHAQVATQLHGACLLL